MSSISGVLKTVSGQTLPALAGVLRKAAANAAERGVAEEVFLTARLYPDMFPLARQVQIATDMVARGAARLAGVEFLSLPDVETTFEALIARIDKVDAFIKGCDAAAIDANEATELQIPMGPNTTMPMTGRAYLLTFVLPNLYFHAATAYGILRHSGVPLGKRDFLTAG